MEQDLTVGKRVERLRKLAGISAQTLADRAGLTRAIVTNIESGRRSDPTVTQLLALALALGVNPADLVFDIEDPYAPIELPGGLVTVQWLARRWFEGELTALEMFPVDGQPANVRDVHRYRHRTVPRMLRERSETMLALATHEDHVAYLEQGWGAPTESVAEWLGDDIAALKRKIRDYRAELYEVDRELRGMGVNLDRPPVHPGVPF